MIPVLPSAALTVRFLTRRFIGEYGDMGECQARASSQQGLGSRDSPASACGISLQPILSCLSPEPFPASRGSMLYLFSDPSLCSRTVSLGCKRSRVAVGDTMKMTIFFFPFWGARIHLQPQPDCGWPRDSLTHLGRPQFPGERAPLLSPVSTPGTKNLFTGSYLWGATGWEVQLSKALRSEGS